MSSLLTRQFERVSMKVLRCLESNLIDRGGGSVVRAGFGEGPGGGRSLHLLDVSRRGGQNGDTTIPFGAISEMS